jgi:hypothetical protein
MKPPVPGSEDEFVMWKQQGRGQVERVETARVALQDKLSSALG